MEAVPLLAAVGVNVAVRVSPEPEMVERLPPETITSPVVPSQEKVLPGSSEKEKVMVAVCSEPRAGELLVMVRVGARVS